MLFKVVLTFESVDETLKSVLFVRQCFGKLRELKIGGLNLGLLGERGIKEPNRKNS